MAIAFERIARFKAWVKGGIANFFRRIKNSIVRTIRGPRGGNGNGSAGADIIALEVTDEKDFQVHLLPASTFTTANDSIFQGENGDLKNRGVGGCGGSNSGGLKVDINHVSIPLGGKASNNSTNNIAENFPDSSIGEGMELTIQGANGHVKHNTDNQSLKSYDSKCGGGPPRTNGNGHPLNNDNEKLNKYSDMSIGLGMDISIRGDGDAANKEAAASAPDENGWGVSRHSSLQFDEKIDGDELKNGGTDVPPDVDDDILSQTEIKHVEEVLIDPVDDVVVEDCCPEVCYRVCPCCIGDPDSPFWQLWYRHRLQVSR